MCQHFASNSGFVIKVQGTGINVYGVFRKTYARNNTRRWWARATLRKRTTRSRSCFQPYWKSLRTTKATRSCASDLFAFSCQFCECLCSQTWDVDTSERMIGVFFFPLLFFLHRHDDVTPSWFRALESHVFRVPNGNGMKKWSSPSSLSSPSVLV